MTRKKKACFIFVCFVACWIGLGAQSLIRLTEQVVGVLPIANGGTAVTALSSLSLSSFGGSLNLPSQCPTCATGPDNTIYGGIIGSFFGGRTTLAANSAAWGGVVNVSSAPVVTPVDLTINNLTVTTTTANGAGSLWTIGINNFAGTVVNTQTQPLPLTIGNNAAAGTYQQSSMTPGMFFGNGSTSSINLNGIFPTGSTSAAVRMMSANIVGVAKQWLVTGLKGSTVAISSTVYASPSDNGVPNSTEANAAVLMPFNTAASNLCIYYSGAGPAGGTFVLTMRKNGTTSTALAVTVAASAGVGEYCDNSDTVALMAGDWITWQLTNNSGSAVSATLASISMAIATGGGPTGMVVFNFRRSFTSGSTYYMAGLASDGSANTTEANTQTPAPRAFTAKNFYCYVNTAPGTNPLAVFLRNNTANTALTVSVTTSTTGSISDTNGAHAVSIANKDLFDVSLNQSSGTAPVVSSCSMEID